MPNTDQQYHILCKPGDVGKYCILTGDPGRCEKIAGYFDAPALIQTNREYVTYTGMLEGEKISVVSTGIGGPSAAIAMEELIQVGAEQFIRVGTCGGIHLDVCAGDLIIAQSAVRQEGTTYEYAPVGYPATADFSLTCALKEAAEALKSRYHIGVIQSKDSFYGQHSPQSMPISAELLHKWQAYKQLGVLGSEMEAAALFIVAASRGVRCGAVFASIWNQEREAAGLPQEQVFDTDLAVRCAVEAFRSIIRQSRE